MSLKFVNLLCSLYSHTSNRVGAYGGPSNSYENIAGVLQGCSISPFLFNFVVDHLLKNALGGLQNVDVQLPNDVNPCDPDYADDLACLLKPEILPILLLFLKTRLFGCREYHTQGILVHKERLPRLLTGNNEQDENRS